MKNYKKTIFALSTPWGKSATALIRLSGAESHKCIKEMSSNMPTKQNIATFNKIKTIDGDIIDHSVTTFLRRQKAIQVRIWLNYQFTVVPP